MEKNSVVQKRGPSPGGAGEKRSGASPRCPWCDTVAQQRGQTLSCPVHGSEPWEGATGPSEDTSAA